VKALRKLVLGETWTVPAGVAVVLAGAVALGELAPATWRDAGAPAVLAAVVLVLVAGLAGPLRRR